MNEKQWMKGGIKMSFIDDMKIGKKLIGGFLVVVLILVVVAAIGYVQMGALDKADTALYEDRALPLAQLGIADSDFQQMRAELYRYIAVPESRATAETTIAELRTEIKKNMDAYRATTLTAEEKTNLAAFDTNYAVFNTQFDATIAAVDKKDQKAVDAALAEGSPLITARTGAATAIDGLVTINIDEAKKLSDANTALYNSSSMMMIIATIVGIIIAIALALFLSKSITGPLDLASKNLKELGNGHLGNRMKMNRKDEIGEMATTMDAFSDDLQNNVVGVMKKISAGQFKMQYLKPKDNQDEITPALIDTLKAVLELTAETTKLSTAAVEGKLDTRADVTKLKGDYRKIVEGVNNTLDAVIGPLNVAAEYVDRISKGDIPAKITDNYNGDFNEIKNNLNVCIGSISALVADAAMLRTAAIEGKLDTRADASKHQGDYKKIVQGVDDCLDAVIGPLNVAAEYVDRISKGDIPPKITDNYNGDFNEIKSNLNNCIGSINMLVADAHMLEKAAVDGNLATRADTTKHHGDYKKIVVGVNSCLDSVIGPLNVAADYVDKISKGAIPAKITDPYNGDFNIIKGNLNTCIDSINALVADAGMLRTAAIEGKLDTRADASKHQGDYRKIVQGVDDCLDAVIGPLNVAAEYVDRISKGDIPAKITDNYNGDFNEIKGNLNNCIGSINALVADAGMLRTAAIEGKLDTRADASKHQGDYKKIVQGVDDCLDAVIGPLNVAAEYVERISKGDIPPKITDKYNGDFNEIKGNLNTCIDSINLLVSDAGMLAKAADEGKLQTRADATKHQGDFKKIVDGVNNTLDLVINPVNEAMRLSEEYSHCNFNARVDENLKVSGDFVKFKNALNSIGSSVQETIGLVNTQTTENAKCNFTSHIDDTAHVQGDFIAIKNSLNSVTNEVAKAFSSVNLQITELAANAQEATASAKEVAAGAGNVATSVNNVSVAAEKGNEGIKQILKAVEDLSASVEEVTANTDSVTNLARETNKLTKAGAELAGQAEQGMVSITKSTSEVDAIIGDIKVRMNKIGEIVGIITNLANQTNLLALNAAIEAARAGDAGKGFAVVASEVKSLAEESRESAENIARMISTLQEQTEKAAVAMNGANNEVKIGSGALAETIVFFNKIVKSVDEITTSMEEVAKASEAQAKTVVELTTNVQNVSTVNQSTAKEATDAAAATQETSASIDQIATVINTVNTIVEKVTRETSKFRV